MEENAYMFPWLDLIDRPAFCVKDGVVISVNEAAQKRMVQAGTDIREIVTEHRQEYDAFENGCLYLTATVGGLPCNVSICRTKECDIFLLNRETDDEHLQTLALAAQQLRIPLSNVIAVTDRLLANPESEATRQQAGQIHHGLYQLLRILNNMSDSGSYRSAQGTSMQIVNLTAVVGEIIEKVQTLCADTGNTLTYTGPDTPVLGAANEEKLGRALYNLLSNALKFSPAGSTVEAKLIQRDKQLSFTVCNRHAEDLGVQDFWSRFRREPSIEDSRYGLGLGMTLVSAVAAAHGGTVLIDHPDDNHTRVTMTIAITKDSKGDLRSPLMHIGDYAGGRDKGLLEFAEILPYDVY